MKVRCEECGREFDVPEMADDGRVSICPTCLDKRGGVPELPAYRRNPKLRLIRPDDSVDAGAKHEGNSLVSRVTARVKAEERRRRLAKLKKSVANVFWMFVLVGIGLSAYRFWLKWKGKACDPILQDVVRMSGGVAAGAVAPDGSQSGVNAATQKFDRLDVAAANSLQMRDGKSCLTSLETLRKRFTSCRLSYWGSLPKEMRPGKVDAVFHLLVPTRDGTGKYYEIRSCATNVLSLAKVTENETVTFPGSAEYVKLMRSQGGFVMREGTAYLVMPPDAKRSFQAPLAKGSSFNPAAEMLGQAYQFARKMDVSGHCFAVSFILNEGDEPVQVAKVPFGQVVPHEAFAKVAAPIARAVRRKEGQLQRSEAEMKLLRKLRLESEDAPVQGLEIDKVLAAGKVFVRRECAK